MLANIIRRSTLPAFNPDFPATDEQIEAEWQRLSRTRGEARLARPLVVLAGWRAPSAQVKIVSRAIQDLTGIGNDQLLALHYALRGDHLGIIRGVVKSVRERFGDHPVDAIGVSMGGLVARAAAAGVLDQDGAPVGRVRLARLFTLATPHRGAEMAKIVRPDPAAAMMRPGSAFLRSLDAALERADYELVCYARLRDRYVGTLNCAPPGRPIIWTPGLIVGSHFSMSHDRRILVDIARRLRGEEPLARPSIIPRKLALTGR